MTDDKFSDTTWMRSIATWEGKPIKFTEDDDLKNFHRRIFQWGCGAGFKIILDEENRFYPTEPFEAYRRFEGVASAGPPLPDDAKLLANYEKRIEKWTDLCAKFRAAYWNCLSDTVRQVLESNLGEDVEIGTIENIRRMMQTLEDYYGQYTVEKGESNFLALKNIPAFTSAESITKKGEDGIQRLRNLITRTGSRRNT